MVGEVVFLVVDADTELLAIDSLPTGVICVSFEPLH